MAEAGQRLRAAREALNLTYREVEEISTGLAGKYGADYGIPLSRLADIENRGTVPSIQRIYSLAVIYRLDVNEILEWYGIPMGNLASDAVQIEHRRTHLVRVDAADGGEVQLPLTLDPGMNPARTTYLSRMIQRWGRLPLMMLNGLDAKNKRYGLIGTEDWSMFPLLQPGALVVIDQNRRKIVNAGWTTEVERPIYFIEHRDGWSCGWCAIKDDELIVFPHPASPRQPVFYKMEEVDVVGQVTGVAMHLDHGLVRRTQL